MKKTLIVLCVFFWTAYGLADSTISDTDFVELTDSTKIKFSTLAQSKNQAGYLITSAIFQTYIKDSGQIFITDRYVVNSECDRGYGQLYTLDIDGKFIYKSEYAIGGNSNASIVANALCTFYKSKKNSLEKQTRNGLKSEAETKWRNTINEFIATEKLKIDGIDYQGNSEMMSALDNYVKALANDIANENKTMLWFLVEADRLVKLKYSLNKK